MVSKRLAILALLAIAVAVANASVFVYYPASITAKPVAPPVYFAGGTNANQTDLSGQISVLIGPNQTSTVIEVHPTYQTTYYHDILQIKSDANAPTLYFKIMVSTPLNVTDGQKGYLILNLPDGTTETVDLTQQGAQPNNWLQLNPGDTVSVDLKFLIPEGEKLPKSLQSSIYLVYTNDNTAANIPQP